MREEENYWKRAMQLRLSRRTMLRNAGLAGLGLAGTAILGCNNQGQAQPNAAVTAAGQNPTAKPVGGSSPVANATASSATTAPSGSLKIAINFHSADLDPQRSTGNTYQGLNAAMFDSLLELDANAQVRPGLAERWEIAKDGLTHTFYIRKGVKFHDGSDLTGADVKFSIDRFVGDQTITGSEVAIWRTQVAKVELRDDYTVTMYMKQPQYELLVGFESFSGAAAVLPKKYIETKGEDYFKTHPVGSGPWKFVSWDPGNRMEIEAAPSHWRAVPQFKNITFLYVPEEATKVAMLKTGELDIADIAPDSVAGIKAAGLRAVSHDGASQFFGWPFFDIEHPEKWPFSDVRVRKALSLAINRQELADKIYSGYATPSTLLFAPKTSFFYDPNVLKPDPFDLDQAKKLVVEAGYPNGLSMKIWDTGGGGVVSILNQALAGYWRKVGINGEIVPIEYTTLSQKAWGGKQQSPDVWGGVYTFVSGGGIFQFEKMVRAFHSVKGLPKNVKNTKLDELIDKVPLTADPAEKKKIAIEAAVLAKNEFTTLSMLDVFTVFALSSKVGNFTPIKNITGLAASLDTMSRGK